jgi:DNA invertase Pin-like site-specific DNA recombinase
MPPKEIRRAAAIYARVSTDDRRQDPETQLRELRDFVASRGFTLAGEYIDMASGRSEERPNYRRLLADVRAGDIDVVLCWRYDRFARSTQALINALKEFQRLGVAFISYQENVDTATPQGEMVFAIMASLAQFESALIGERVKAGMARAKAQGKHVGRPPLSPAVRDRIRKLWEDDTPSYSISKRLNVAYTTVRRYVKKLETGRGRSPAAAAARP